MAQRSIQTQVRERELSSKLPTDPHQRVRHTDVDTRSDEASKGQSLRSPTTCAGGEDRAERESSVGGGPTGRIQDLRLDEWAGGVSGYLPCLEEQRGCLPWQQHKRGKVCLAVVLSFQNESSFFHPLPCNCHHCVHPSRSRLVRYFGPIVSHCPLKTALTSFPSRRPLLSLISNADLSSKYHGNLSYPLRQPPPMSISLEIVPITRRLELEGEPDGS